MAVGFRFLEAATVVGSIASRGGLEGRRYSSVLQYILTVGLKHQSIAY